jgi:hypothetical protein
MPAPTIVAGAPCWIDLYSSDTEKAAAFYGGLLGWTASPPDESLGGYFVFLKDGKAVAGCMTNDGEQGYPDAWGVHLLTDDAQRTAEAATANGGKVHFGPLAVAENGVTAMIADPGGANIGAWQPGTQRGFELRNEVGAAAWFELHTREYEKSVDFYREVFGWDAHAMSDTEEFRYTTLGEGEGALAGIMDASAFLPDGAPATWSVYFEVEDADAALARAEELGGSVVRDAEDTPYGRLGEVADPTGTHFRVLARS